MVRHIPLAGAFLATAALAAVVAASVWTSPALASVTVTCTTPVDSGGCADFVVPNGVSSITIEVWGAAGGAGGSFGAVGCPATPPSEAGGYVKATDAVSPGDTFHLYVGAKGRTGACGALNAGGAGGNGGNDDANGGLGGAGFGASNASNGGGGGGGGESDVRFSGTALSDRVVAAGGGGGTGGTGAAGGGGGGSPALHGDDSGGETAKGGAGATRIAPGPGGSGNGPGGDGSAGSSADGGTGGDANDVNGAGGGGGGGGGLFGGGGGEAGSNTDGGAGGGGGSGWVQGAAAFVSQQTASNPGNSGNGKIVITYAIPPHTRPAAGLTATSATLRGVDDNTDAYHFEYGTDTSYGTTTPNATATGLVSAGVTGLTPSTTYHYRIDSTDGGPGNDVPFTTLALPVTTSPADLTGTSVTLQGTDANGGESYHFEWGETTTYGSSTATAVNNGGTLSAALTGLRSGSTYHYHIVSDAGAGADVAFTTLHFPVTLPAASVTESGALLEGIDANTGTTYHFQYGTTTAYGHSTAAHSANGSTATVSTAVSGLAPATTYHFRIVDSGAGPGHDTTFTTGTHPARDLILGLHGPAKGSVGRLLRYVATIGNVGRKTVTGTKLKLMFRGATVQVVSAHGCKGTGKLTCTIPKILAGKAVRVKVVVRLALAATLTLKGSLVTTFRDPTPRNDRATTRTIVK